MSDTQTFIRLTNQLMDLPLYAWEGDELKSAECELQTMPSSIERNWWLDHVRQEMEKRTPPAWWPEEMKDTLDPNHEWHAHDRS